MRKESKKLILFISAMVFSCAAILSGCSSQGGKESTHVHSYMPSIVAPTCNKDGFTLFTCLCGDSYSDQVNAALGHDYVSEKVLPSYERDGYTAHLCSRCGDEYKDDYTKLSANIYHPSAIKDYLLPVEDFSRERKHEPEFVMIHFISGVVLSKNDPYNKDLVRGIFEDYGVSVHYIIDREGEVRCYIPEEVVAYHAGLGTWNDDPKYKDLMNEYAIGIEVMAIGSEKDMSKYLTKSEYGKLAPELIGYTDAQYTALQELVGGICRRYGIPMDREHVIGHDEYTPSKTDPGELFDWDRLLNATE